MVKRINAKKVLAGALMIAAVFVIAAVGALTVSASTFGGAIPDSSLTWEFDESTGTLTISGTGEMPNFVSEFCAIRGVNVELENAPWQPHWDSITTVIIEYGVTRIGNSAFRNYAFSEHHLLTSVTIPASVTVIGHRAFTGNKSLLEVVIPYGVTTIEASAFRDNLLRSVIIPDSVTEIGLRAFSENAIMSVQLGSGITVITDAFSYNLLANVIIPNSVTEIWDNAFWTTGLTSAIIGDSVTMIGGGAFSLTKLETIYFTSATPPPNVSDYAFLLPLYWGWQGIAPDARAIVPQSWEAQGFYVGKVWHGLTVEFGAPADSGAVQPTPTPTPTPTPPVVTRPAGQLGVTINGVEQNFNPPPMEIGGSMMLPFRAIGEALGMTVSSSGGVVTLTAPGVHATHVARTNVITVNGTAHTFAAPSTAVEGRLLMPLRMFSAIPGITVRWDSPTRTAVVTTE